MLWILLRVLMKVGPAAAWFSFFMAAVIAVFVLYTGIALWAVLRPCDQHERDVRYQVFRDLLGLFRHGKQR
jgi:Gpi18-like mannosyltransferase